MDARCHHHPGREAVGTCCYCDRPLCEECLSTNREGKSYCRREDDCLAYQDEQSSPGEPTSPILSYLIDAYSLDVQERRVSEILEELEVLKELHEDVEGEDQRIAGFCACKLTEEAAALLSLISLRVDFMRKEYEQSGDAQTLERANEVKGFIERDAKPKIAASLDWAKPYGNLDVSELSESAKTKATTG